MGLGVFLVVVAIIILANAVRILTEYERGVVFRLGRLIGVKGPGLFFLIPLVDRMVRVSLRTVTFDVQPQEIMTKDNVPAKVNAVVYFRVLDPAKAIVEVENYQLATMQIAQTTLRGVLGQSELDELLSEREKINSKMQQIVDEQTDPWGIKVSVVEIKEVELPDSMKRAMARQAEVERERRAKVINAQGEYQASTKLAAAAKILSQFPEAIQLRYLQTANDIAAEKNSTIVFPIPIDLLGIMKKLAKPEEKPEEKPKG